MAHLRRRPRPARATRRSIRSTRTNFNKLEVAWRFKTDSLGPRPEFNFQSTPLMVDGVLYSTAGHAPRRRRARRRQPARCCGCTARTKASAAKRRRASSRAAASRTGPTATKRASSTSRRAIRWSRSTRRPASRVAGFGNERHRRSEAETTIRTIDPMTGEIGLHATPIIAKDVIIVGAAHLPGGAPEEHDATRRASSAATTCAPASGCGSSTPSRCRASSATRRWEKDSWSYTGNAGVWAQMTRRRGARARSYLPVELPTGDYYGGHRPGQRPVRREPRRARSEDRQAQVALPARAPRHLGHGHPVRADPGRHHRRRQRDQGGRAADQAGVALRVRSRHRASRCGRSRSGRCRKATCRASGIRRRSRSSPSRRRSIGRACRSTI